METFLVITAYLAVAVILFQLLPTKKNLNNVKEKQNKKKQKLLRFTRGNKTLNPEQQKELDRLNKSNYATLKQMWNNEHL